jgi:hypothetical protein
MFSNCLFVKAFLIILLIAALDLLFAIRFVQRLSFRKCFAGYVLPYFLNHSTL